MISAYSQQYKSILGNIWEKMEIYTCGFKNKILYRFV